VNNWRTYTIKSEYEQVEIQCPDCDQWQDAAQSFDSVFISCSCRHFTQIKKCDLVIEDNE